MLQAKEEMMKKWMLVLTVLSAAVCRADYVDEVMADSPEAYYRFEESLGFTQMQDSSGNGYDSAAVSNVTFERNGIIGWSGGFATNGSVRLDFNRSPAAGDFSVECLVHFPDAALNCTLVSQQDGSGTGRAILYQEDGTLKSFLGGIETAVAEPPSTNLWHHLVLTSDFENQALTLYIDGRIAAEQSVAVEAADGAWMLGMDPAGQAGHQGRLDEVAVYPHCLEKARVQRHFQYLRGMHPLYYVATNGTSVAPFSSWETAATNVQEAVNLAVKDPRSTVMLGAGKFYVDETFTVEGAQSAGPEHWGGDRYGRMSFSRAGITLQGAQDAFFTYYNEWDLDEMEKCSNIIPVGIDERDWAIWMGRCTLRNIIFGSPPQSGGIYCGSIEAENCHFWTMHVDDLYTYSLWMNNAKLHWCSIYCAEEDWRRPTYPEGVYDCGECYLVGCECTSCYIGPFYRSVSPFLFRLLHTQGCFFRLCHFNHCNVSINNGVPEYKEFHSEMDDWFINCQIFMCGSESHYGNQNTGNPAVSLNTPYYTYQTRSVGPDFYVVKYPTFNKTGDIDGNGISDDVERKLNRIPMLPDQEDRLAALYAEGRARGMAAVQKTPSAYDLYTSDSILELSQGGRVFPASAGRARLNLQLEQSTNLVDGAWTNIGSAVDWQLDLPGSQPFFRVKGTE